MAPMSGRIVLLALCTACVMVASEDGQSMTAPAIMKQVAANQDREQKARTAFVYEEHVHRVMRSKKGKLLHEEYRVFEVTPGAKGTEKKLASVKGRYWKKGRYVSYDGEAPQGGLINITFDGDGDAGTRDGLDKDLFPLTSDEQKQYTFELAGERVIKGRRAYQIRFRPSNSSDYGWTGEALIDREELQPVSVYTRLSRRLPLAVRTMLGTDVPGLGFSVSYTRVDKDLWFPATYGTEFGLRALFLLNRTLSESVENTGFRRAAVESRIEYGKSAGGNKTERDGH